MVYLCGLVVVIFFVPLGVVSSLTTNQKVYKYLVLFNFPVSNYFNMSWGGGTGYPPEVALYDYQPV